LNASPVDTARLLVLTMPASERLQLEKTLPKKDSEIEGLLAQWKTDALPPERPRQIQRPQQKKDALSLTR
jgi:hypothetical protein